MGKEAGGWAWEVQLVSINVNIIGNWHAPARYCCRGRGAIGSNRCCAHGARGIPLGSHASLLDGIVHQPTGLLIAHTLPQAITGQDEELICITQLLLCHLRS